VNEILLGLPVIDLRAVVTFEEFGTFKQASVALIGCWECLATIRRAIIKHCRLLSQKVLLLRTCGCFYSATFTIPLKGVTII
jgi:hypothetical protein